MTTWAHPLGRRLAALAAAAVLVLGLGACGPREDEWAGRGTPITADPREPEPPRPETSVDGVGGVRRALEARVIAAAGVIRPVASSCDGGVIGFPFECTITYEGIDVTYQVTSESRPVPGTRSLFSWDAKPDALIATRAGIEAALWRAYATRASALSCDAELPATHRTPPAATLPWRCYFKPVHDDVAFGEDSSNHGLTVGVDVTVYDGRIGFTETTQ